MILNRYGTGTIFLPFIIYDTMLKISKVILKVFALKILIVRNI
jgi:hypothetical protein